MNVCHCQYLNKESLLFVFVFVFFSSVYNGCSSPPPSSAELNLEGNWQLHHLEGTKVTLLAPDEEGLFAGTEAGLFQLNGTEIVPLGLGEHKIVGVVRLKNGGILASVKTSSFSSGDTSLFRSLNKGESWEPFMNNFGGEDGKYTGINKGPVAITPRSDTLLIRGNISVVLSIDGGNSWTVSSGQWDSWGGYGALIQVDSLHSGFIWAGGINPFSEPYLIRSRNYGKSWERLESIKELDRVIVEGTAFAVITHPDNPDWLIAGLDWAARKSTDGGQSWRMVLEETGVHAFARSLQNPGLIYASGRHASTKLFFAYTSDFGETWQKEIFEEGPDVVTTNSLAVQVIDGQEVLFLGTNKGVYSFEVN